MAGARFWHRFVRRVGPRLMCINKARRFAISVRYST